MSSKDSDDLDLTLGVVALLGFCLLMLAIFKGDIGFARLWFFDVAHNDWVGRNEWWANELLHTGGRNVMRTIGLLGVLAWAASFRSTRLSLHGANLGYFAACMVLVPLAAGILKQVTNVDCPWDLQGFGGAMPVVHWFEARPAGLPRAACFPGAHSSSAFALFSLFFLLRGTKPRLAKVFLAVTWLIGIAFSLAQQSRGAHFLSHDVASALLAWLICFGLYRLRERVHEKAA